MDALPDLNALVDSLTTERYVILGDLPTTTQPAGSAAYNALSTLWDAIENDVGKARFIRLNDALVKYGLDLAGINPTATDRANIARGVAPDSLRSDGFHPSQAGYAVVKTIVVQRLRQLGLLPQAGRPVDALSQPSSLAAGRITMSSVALTCAAVAEAVGYRFTYRPVGASAWNIGAIGSTPSATVEGLT